jgi:hypothetical protein
MRGTIPGVLVFRGDIRANQVIGSTSAGAEQFGRRIKGRAVFEWDAAADELICRSLILGNLLDDCAVAVEGYAPMGEIEDDPAAVSYSVGGTYDKAKRRWVADEDAPGEGQAVATGLDATFLSKLTDAPNERYADGEVYVVARRGGEIVARGQLEVDWDDDGLTHSREDLNKNGSVDPGETDPFDRDSDDDGLLDGEEAMRLGLGHWNAADDDVKRAPDGSDPLEVDTESVQQNHERIPTPDGLADGLEIGMTKSLLDERVADIGTKSFVLEEGEPAHSRPILGTAAYEEVNGLPMHGASGLLLADQDPNTWTDPRKTDTDGDGFYDGKNIWVTWSSGETTLQRGEDRNGDGKYEPAGEDGELEPEWKWEDEVAGVNGNRFTAAAALWDLATTGDDETDPAERPSAPPGPRNGGNDDDQDGEPDFLEAAQQALTTFDFWDYGDAPLLGLGEHEFNLRFTIEVLKLYFDVNDNDDWNSWFKTEDLGTENINNSPLLANYFGTFTNGVANFAPDAIAISKNLSQAYRIPVTTMYNPTLGTVFNVAWLDFGEARMQLGLIAAYGFYENTSLSPVQKYICSEDLFNKWKTISSADKKSTIVHFAHSQGAIITAPTLHRFKVFDHEAWRKRLQVVFFGNAFPYALNSYSTGHILPDNHYHFVTTADDGFTRSVGTRWIRFKNEDGFGGSRFSLIVNYPYVSADWPELTSSHTFWPNGNYRNTYGWYIHNIGGPTFRLEAVDHPAHEMMIHGERAHYYHISSNWWYSLDLTVQSKYQESDLDWVMVEKGDEVYSPSDSYSPKDELPPGY